MKNQFVCECKRAIEITTHEDAGRGIRRFLCPGCNMICEVKETFLQWREKLEAERVHRLQYSKAQERLLEEGRHEMR